MNYAFWTREFWGIDHTLPLLGPPKSFIEYARRRGCLVGPARVVPDRLHWEGQVIEVLECWLQKERYGNVLYLALKTNGRLQQDFLSFNFVGDDDRIIARGQLGVRNMFDLWKSFIPGLGAPTAFVVHLVRFRAAVIYPHVVQLRIKSTSETNAHGDVITCELLNA